MRAVFILFILLGSSVLLSAQAAWGENALTFYGELRNRTILRPSDIPRFPDEVLSQALADTNRAVAIIEAALRKIDFKVVEDGDKFLRVMPNGWEDYPAGQYLSSIPAIHSPQKLSTTKELLPKGAINLANVEIHNALKLYAEYRRRNILKPLALPGSISLRAQTPLTTEEISYALNVVMALNGIAAVDDGEKFVQVVPVFQLNQLKLNAPQPERNGYCIKPEEVPQLLLLLDCIQGLASHSNSTHLVQR